MLSIDQVIERLRDIVEYKDDELGPNVAVTKDAPLWGFITQVCDEVERLQEEKVNIDLMLASLQEETTGAKVAVKQYCDHMEAEVERLRESNRRLNRRCQEAEAMETEFKHAANALRTAAVQAGEAGAWAKHWLDRLRLLVRMGEEAAEKGEANAN